jgi:hypothetical protein
VERTDKVPQMDDADDIVEIGTIDWQDIGGAVIRQNQSRPFYAPRDSEPVRLC